MRRVITASLNGNAYQIEDDAYQVLANYLDESTRALAGNPDKDEIIADVEQAIADKFARYLSSHKTVISLEELNKVLAEMGPVEGSESSAGTAPGADAAGRSTGAGAAPGSAPGVGAGAAAGSASPRRLYQISDGAVISGVCNGLAAYFGVDVTIVRLIFVVFALFYGIAVPVYLVLMFVVPYAQTSEQHAAAHGIPFNARTLVESAKAKAAQFTTGNDWRRSKDEWRAEWRRSRDEWRAEWRQARAERRAARAGAYAPPPPPAPPPPRMPYAAHLVSGLVTTLLGLVLMALTIAMVIAIVSLATTGAILGWFLPIGIPFWVGIILLVVVYEMVAWPLKALRHTAAYPDGRYPPRHPFEGALGFAVLMLLGWWAYHHVPEVRELFEHIRDAWNGIIHA